MNWDDIIPFRRSSHISDEKAMLLSFATLLGFATALSLTNRSSCSICTLSFQGPLTKSESGRSGFLPTDSAGSTVNPVERREFFWVRMRSECASIAAL
jgi:hypothetical protein